MSTSRFLPFALPDIGEAEIAEVVDTLRSGWITTGPKTRRFEEDFVRFLGADGVTAVAVNSATAGLHLAVEALGIGPGDKVIVPTHTFTATAEVIRYVGADPVFVDVDPVSYCISISEISKLDAPDVKAVIPVHFAGHPCDMASLQRICRLHDWQVVEDAAHALPTRSAGQLIGTLDTAVTVFSFYATKTIATGEGGMLVTRRPELANRARVMRLHGIDRDSFDRYSAAKPSWYYEVIAPGFKYNMTDVAASIGIHQLKRASAFQERRTAIAMRYLDELRGLPIDLPPVGAAGDTHAWHLFVVRLAAGHARSRDEVVSGMYAHGIGCSVHYVPLHRQPYWRDRYKLDPSSFPVSESLYQRGFSIPIYTKMSDGDQTRVIQALREVLS
jgi:dTDP-4-amino-4,6-dideoxygalactose transaminase